jgi:acetylornithine/N-succinyldiaminopimelate aminotransferase
MPFTEGFCHVPANDIDAMMAAMTPDVCAVMVEFVQGEGGVNALDKEYVSAIAAACAEKDILLIADEVQTGNGRTGTLYAFEQFGVKPDIISTAKGLGGGLPIGAVILGEKVKDTLSAGTHGSTFGGNPACAAGALNVISRLDENFLTEVRAKSEYIFTRLASMKGVISVSGLGLMIGVKAEKPTPEIISAGIERGVLFLSAKDKLRLLPPLNITYKEIDEALAILAEILEK